MSETSESIADLDDELRRVGQDVALVRVVADGDDVTSPVVKAFVRGYRPNELTGGIQQGDTLVVLSPTGLPAPFNGLDDPDDFLRRGDRVEVAGRSPRIEYVDPVLLDGAQVRINLLVRG
ncbi:hypothetical protein R1A27_20185 [Methylobacterium sp. NMS12]|uniref:hypothetical protein n=1 Tax=Methylobacterium sp. NMS12 TaxID=3079766 RepID=UPI003F885337